jgi:hypothetical protein
MLMLHSLKQFVEKNDNNREIIKPAGGKEVR